jgi:hypothetical protein
MPTTTRSDTPTAPRTLNDVVAQSQTRDAAPATTHPNSQSDDRFEQSQDDMQRQARLWSEGFGGIASVEELLLR